MGTAPEHLEAGRDYPKNWAQFLRWFPDDGACLAYIERLRWGGRFVCPSCGAAEEPWRQTRGRLTCRACRHQASVTAGTIFHRARTPLTLWFAAMWYVTNQKFGASALGLQRVLGFNSYQTAWTMLHKLRRAMVRPGRERLRGVVEVDETYVGSDADADGREAETKAIIAIAIEVTDPRGFGRVRLRQIDDVSTRSLVPFVRDVVTPGAVVRTDGLASYRKLSELGYQHRQIVLTATETPAHVLLPGVHRIASLLKRWLLGTHQGAVLPQHLDYYLDEYTFRFNRRTARSRGLLFYRLLEQAVVTGPTTYRQIVRGSTDSGTTCLEESAG